MESTTTEDFATQAEAAPAEQAAPEGQAQPDKAAEAAPEPDYKAEYARLQQEKSDLEHRLKSAEGRLKTRQTSEDVADLKAEVRRLTREFRRTQTEIADLEPEQKQQRLQELDREEQAEQQTVATIQYAQKLARRINANLTRAGISTDHAKVQDALEKWKAAKTPDDFDSVYDMLDDFIDAETAARSKREQEAARKKAEEDRKAANREEGTLAVGGAGGLPTASMTDADAWKAYGRGELPWSKRVQEAGKKLGYLD